MRIFAFVLCVFLPTTAGAQPLTDRQADYVGANAIAIFYHELAHALIDIQRLPVFGQEEDGADVFSILMIDYLFEEDASAAIAYDTANGFYYETLEAEENGYEPAYWDVHGISQQRYYNTVCLYFGGNVDERSEFADELGLPEDRSYTCEEERALADDSWGNVLDDLENPDKSQDFLAIKIDAGTDTPARQIWATETKAEVQALNEWLELDTPLQVTVAECGEANAFYDPSSREITMCVEYADFLGSAAETLFTDG